MPNDPSEFLTDDGYRKVYFVSTMQTPTVGSIEYHYKTTERLIKTNITMYATRVAESKIFFITVQIISNGFFSIFVFSFPFKCTCLL